MSPDYKRLRGEADRIYYRFNDVLDDKGAAGSLVSEVRNVVEDFDQQKKPRSIEDRIKRVQQQLRALDDQCSTAMDASDIDDLLDRYEELRQDLHDLDNY